MGRAWQITAVIQEANSCRSKTMLELSRQGTLKAHPSLKVWFSRFPSGPYNLPHILCQALPTKNNTRERTALISWRRSAKTWAWDTATYQQETAQVKRSTQAHPAHTNTYANSLRSSASFEGVYLVLVIISSFYSQSLEVILRYFKPVTFV